MEIRVEDLTDGNSECFDGDTFSCMYDTQKCIGVKENIGCEDSFESNITDLSFVRYCKKYSGRDRPIDDFGEKFVEYDYDDFDSDSDDDQANHENSLEDEADLLYDERFVSECGSVHSGEKFLF